MEEKRTLKEFMKENKGKIIKGGLIVVGLVAGVMIIKVLTTDSDKAMEIMENLELEGPDLLSRIDDISETVEKVV